MATIQIRDLPQDTYDVFRKRAADAGQSLQAYMRQHLIEVAAKPNKAELVARILERQKRAPVSWTAEQIVEAIHAERRYV